MNNPFIDIRKKIKRTQNIIEKLEERVKSLEKDLPNESDWSRKNSMQLSRKSGKALIKELQNYVKELERFL